MKRTATMPAGASAQVTLVELAGDVSFRDARYVIAPTHEAPDRSPPRPT